MSLAETFSIYSTEEMKKLKTRQLLAHLRHTYVWGPDWDEHWGKEMWDEKSAYQAAIKAELATREHIPNKIEAKAIRRARAKALK